MMMEFNTVPGLKITLLQQPLVWMDGPANLRHFDRQLEGITGRDVIVLPEMFTTGFAMEAAKHPKTSLTGCRAKRCKQMP